ncbi:hypothetical protein [Thalassovita aquimarina]|uniref:Uncharacterized protein n=1 Tax=Thalassovita aquimarina TaxID=2785917 RepID=A0ABS5HW75_9RHOB|nr:hypothetical protein [Thalassovita aquimarina]MBR9652818.1 hypothetical protein [Thalassovita aquimarina]
MAIDFDHLARRRGIMDADLRLIFTGPKAKRFQRRLLVSITVWVRLDAFPLWTVILGDGMKRRAFNQNWNYIVFVGYYFQIQF